MSAGQAAFRAGCWEEAAFPSSRSFMGQTFWERKVSAEVVPRGNRLVRDEYGAESHCKAS